MKKLPDVGCDVELGGHDQIFNLLVGRDLMKDEGQEPQVCLTVPLLVGLDGHEKMSKSLGNSIGVSDAPREIYGKTMSIPDSLMWDWLLLLTDLAEGEIAARKRGVAAGELHPKAVKQELARTLVAQYHDADAARDAEAEFERVFAQKGVPDEVPEVEVVAAAAEILSLLRDHGRLPSMKEAQRRLAAGSLSVDGVRLEAADRRPRLAARAEPYLLRYGSRDFLRVRVREDRHA
jgi:tyrosyl-tRNA synthetase